MSDDFLSELTKLIFSDECTKWIMRAIFVGLLSIIAMFARQGVVLLKFFYHNITDTITELKEDLKETVKEFSSSTQGLVNSIFDLTREVDKVKTRLDDHLKDHE